MFILISLFIIPFVSSANRWNNYGGNERSYFIQNLGGSVEDVLLESTQNGNYISPYSPLIDDLDGDGLNEIVVITTNNEIRLFRDYNFGLIDAYYNAELTLNGQYAITNFLGDSTQREIVLITNTAGTNFSLWVVNWNGTDFNITKEIFLGDNLTASNVGSHGLTCDDNGECFYFSHKSQLYKYNGSNSFNTLV